MYLNRKRNSIAFAIISLLISLIMIVIFVNNVSKVVIINEKDYLIERANSKYLYKIGYLDNNKNKIKGFIYKKDQEIEKSKIYLILIDNDVYYRIPTYITYDINLGGWSGFVSEINDSIDINNNCYDIALLIDIYNKEMILDLDINSKELTVYE